ncbi:hypothetical protein HPB50_006355 [Hyalomma asiaticum]|uniref:Uncharacterized protein n=1 Tax=Hyalomma asiaticum TaxID=266040 RepID=A0ACB7RZK4_HYAAI|nr:hypothetical protein HPB50_006355 [Hyalomma asiaticum]
MGHRSPVLCTDGYELSSMVLHVEYTAPHPWARHRLVAATVLAVRVLAVQESSYQERHFG